MKYDLSLIIPAIRSHHWMKTYTSAVQSCGKYTFEIIFASPFDLPAELSNMPNVKHIKSYACPSTAFQMAAEQATGELIQNAPDDCIFSAQGYEKAIDLYKSNCSYKDILNVRFTEGFGYNGVHLPDGYWSVTAHQTLCLPGIPRNYRISLGHMMKTEYFKEMGGLDCGYQYPNFNSHDLVFRILYDGGRIYDSPTDVMICEYYTNRAMDHGAIEDAYEEDLRRFTEKYSNPNALNPDTIKIPFDNWKNYQEDWKWRFSKKRYDTYEEMLADK